MESLTVVEEKLQEFVTDTVTIIERYLHDGSFNVHQPHFALHRRFDGKDNAIVLCTTGGIIWKVFYAPEFCEVSPDMVFHMLCVQLYKAGYKERPQSSCVEDGYPALVVDCPYGDPDTQALLSRTYNKMTSYMMGRFTDWRKYTVYLEQPNDGRVFYMFCCRPDKPGTDRTWVVKPDSEKSVDTFAVQMAMLMLNKGYQVRRLYSAPAGLAIDMNQCRRLLEFTAVLDSRETKNNNN